MTKLTLGHITYRASKHKTESISHVSCRDIRQLLDERKTLIDAIDHVLTASEDGGDMNDISWDMLRKAITKAKS